MRRWVTPGLGLFLLAVLLLIIYWPGFSGQWFLDDFGNIHENPNVHADSLSWDAIHPAIYGRSEAHQRIDRPIAYLTLAANYALGGTDPTGYHVVNFLIHILATGVIYLLARTTLALPGIKERYGSSAHAISLLGALLWAVHPIQVTAVTYVIQRMAAMAALFSLAALLCFARGKISTTNSRKTLWYLLCLVLGLLAFGSKQNAVMLPVSITFYTWVFLPASSSGRIHMGRWLWPAGGIILIAIVAGHYVGIDTLTSGFRDRPFTLGERLLTEPRIIWFYLWLLVYPISSQFALLHDVTVSTGFMTPWTTGISIMLLVALAAVAVNQRRKRPLFSFGILFFLVNHAVEGSVLPLELVFEHRNYLPSVFLCVAAGAGIIAVIDHFSTSRFVRDMVIACIILVIIAAGHTTFMRNDLFTSRVALWQQNVDTYPDLHRPRHNLGRALFDIGDIESGLSQMEASLKSRSGARLAQKLVTYFNLGLAYRAKGDLSAAEAAFREVVALARRHKNSWYQLAYIALDRHRPREAMALAERAAAIGGEKFHFHVIMGMAALDENDVESARAHARAALKYPWQDQALFCLLGDIAVATGKPVQTSYFLRRCPFSR
ncbi:MAG: tetratricopeptide repeat protein [Pseudomonadota bacterium]